MSKIVELQKIKIEYLLTGEENSETIVFVHGLGANLSQFTSQQNHFSRKFRVLSINLRGHGKTSLAHKLACSDVELHKLANDITLLLNYLGIPKVHYVGNSMGGNVGLELLKLNPSVLKTLIIFGTIGQLNISPFTLRITQFIHKISPAKLRGNLAKSVGQTKESKSKIKEMMVEIERNTILSFLPILAKFDYLDTINESTIPSIILRGEKDKEINKALGATIETFENRGSFDLIEIDKVGHFANLDNPELFNRIIEESIFKENKVEN